MYRPICLLLMSFSYKLLELLKKQAADNNKNGVVGNKGTKIPIIPNVNDNKPNIVNIIFIFFSSQSSKFKVQWFKAQWFKVQSSMVQSSMVQSSNPLLIPFRHFHIRIAHYGEQSSVENLCCPYPVDVSACA